MIACKNCKTETTDDVTFCPICKYPIKGSSKEQSSFIAKQVIQKSDVKESIKRLKQSRILLYVVGAFHLLVLFTPLIEEVLILDLIINISLGLLFIGFAILSYRKPVLAIGIPLVLIVLYYTTLLIVEPTYLARGFIWRIFVLLGLSYGFFSVLKTNKTLKENSYLASVLGYSKINQAK